jgi:hypothetical protein
MWTFDIQIKPTYADSPVEIIYNFIIIIDKICNFFGKVNNYKLN